MRFPSSSSSSELESSSTESARDISKNEKESVAHKVNAKDSRHLHKPHLLRKHTKDALKRLFDAKFPRCAVQKIFSRYDAKNSGFVTLDAFIKCIKKLGLALNEQSEYDSLSFLFDKSKSDGKPQSRFTKKLSSSVSVDYDSFIEWATTLRLPQELNSVADKICDQMQRYERSMNLTDGESHKIYEDLAELDKSKRGYIDTHLFEHFLRRNSKARLQLHLHSGEIANLTEQFQFKFEGDTFGIDYELLAAWIQPMLHYNIEDLKKKVAEFVTKVRLEKKWDIEKEFRLQDQSNNGIIDLEHFRYIMQQLPLSAAQVRCFEQYLHTDRDGKIQYKLLLPSILDNGSSSADSEQKVEKMGLSKRSQQSDQKVRRNARNTFGWGIHKAFFRKKQQAQSKRRNDNMGKSTSTSDEVKSVAITRTVKSGSHRSGREAHKKDSGSKGKVPSESSISSASDERKKRLTMDKKLNVKKWYAKKGLPSLISSKSTREAIRQSSASSSCTEAKSHLQVTKSRMRHQKDHTKDNQDNASLQLGVARCSESKDVSTSSEAHIDKNRGLRRKSKSTPMGNHETLAESKSRKSCLKRHSRTSVAKLSKPDCKDMPRVKRKQAKEAENTADDTSQIATNADARRSSSSGIIADDLRKITSPKHKSNNSIATSRNYTNQLKQALHCAFEYFDTDRTGTIEISELNQVFYALGYDLTPSELKAEMRRADLDQNGKLEYHEFSKLIKQFVDKKQLLFTKQREIEIREAFEYVDQDKNGYLDYQEFQYFVNQVLRINLSNKELNALREFVDEDGDGIVRLEELVRFFKRLESMQSTAEDLVSRSENLVIRRAYRAMNKLVRKTPINLERNLLVFLGVPSNFRRAVTTSLRLHKNCLEYMLSFPAPQMTITLNQLTTVSGTNKIAVQMRNDTSVPWGSTAISVSKKDRGVLQAEKSILKQAEMSEYQAIISVKRATGVPKPFDTREEDVIKRFVHVCFFQEEVIAPRSSRNTTRKSRKYDERATSGEIIGNVHEIPVYWNAQQEDIWEFSKSATGGEAYKFLARTNQSNDHLSLLIEFVARLRVPDPDGRRKSIGSKHYHNHRSIHRKGENARHVVDKNRTSTVDMVCCWAKVPLKLLLARRNNTLRMQEPLLGGTVYNPIRIDHDEILRRRKGWRALTNVFTAKDPPTVGIKSVPVLQLRDEIHNSICKMPPTILLPYRAIPIVSEYMTYMNSVLAASAVQMCAPVLKVLPKIVQDPNALSAFCQIFHAAMKSTKDSEERRAKFEQLVLQMWPLFVVADPTNETCLANDSTNTFVKGAAASEILDPIKAAANDQDQSLLASDMAAQGKLRMQDLTSASIPFHIREVTFRKML